MKRLIFGSVTLALTTALALSAPAANATPVTRAMSITPATLRSQIITSAHAKVAAIKAIPTSDRFNALPESVLVVDEWTIPYERETVKAGVAYDITELNDLIGRSKKHTTLKQLRADRAYLNTFRLNAYDTYFAMVDYRTTALDASMSDIETALEGWTYLTCDDYGDGACKSTDFDMWVEQMWDDFMWDRNGNDLKNKTDNWLFPLYEHRGIPARDVPPVMSARWTPASQSTYWTQGHVLAQNVADFKTQALNPPYPPSDSDADGVGDAEEAALGTDPNKQDTDGDGVDDYTEQFEDGTDPLDPTSYNPNSI